MRTFHKNQRIFLLVLVVVSMLLLVCFDSFNDNNNNNNSNHNNKSATIIFVEGGFVGEMRTTTLSLSSKHRFSVQSSSSLSPKLVMFPSQVSKTTTSLSERRWNFNDGQAPWGFKKNAEIWNGRFAQMAFVVVLLQELIQGKGVLQGLQEGDPINYIFVGMFAVSYVTLTAILAVKGGDSEYIDSVQK